MNSNSTTQFPDIYIESQALRKLNAYYKYQTTGEISGLGVAYAEEGDVIVQDVLLFDQVSNQSETELDANTLANWMTKLIEEGQDPSLYRLWWHKHPIQGWSSIDNSNIERLKNDAWLLSIVHTPSGLLGRLDIYKPFRITMDQLKIMELRERDDVLETQIKAEIAQKVKAGRTYPVGGAYSYVDGQWWKDGKPSGFGYTGNGIGSASQPQLPPPLPEKKSTVSTTNTASQESETAVTVPDSSTNERDNYFAALADRDWESYITFEEYYREIG